MPRVLFLFLNVINLDSLINLSVLTLMYGALMLLVKA